MLAEILDELVLSVEAKIEAERALPASGTGAHERERGGRDGKHRGPH
jgi:hypothetical protein